MLEYGGVHVEGLQTSDPYVTFYTIPPWAYQPPKGPSGKGAGKRQCTSVAKSTINPVWDDVVDLEIKVNCHAKFVNIYSLNADR